jgi:hypothetical protein
MSKFLAVRFGLDVSEFEKACKFYASVVEKDLAEVVNIKCKDFIIKLTKETNHPEATKEKIESEIAGLPRRYLLSMALRASREKRADKKPKLVIRWDGKTPSRQVMGEAFKSIYKMRAAAARYILRGWEQVGQPFDAYTKTKAFLGGYQRRILGAVGRRATKQKKWGFMRNGSRGAGTVSWDAAQVALRMSVDDMTSYAKRKLEERARESGFVTK